MLAFALAAAAAAELTTLLPAPAVELAIDAVCKLF
jgi:hypothetical protein